MEVKNNNREVILKTALGLFSSRGYESVGIQEIVDRSNITKPTLYYYFGSKRGLLDAIISEYGEVLFNSINENAVYSRDIVQNLTNITRVVINFAISNQAFYRLLQSLSAAAPENAGYAACRPLRISINTCLETLFTEAAFDHGNMKGREKAYSETFQGMIRTWALLILNNDVEFDEQMLYRAVHQFMHGIFS